MDLENKTLVSDLLNALHYIKATKENVSGAKSVDYSEVSKNLLGEYIVFIIHYYPEFLEDFKDFLDREVEYIDERLKDL